MKRYSEPKPISSIIRREEKTDPRPEYQRGPVWSKKQKQLLIDTIPDWINGRLQAQRQNETGATYTKIIKKEDGQINWARPAAEIERQVRAFNPWPGTYTFWKKDKLSARLKILEASMENGKLMLVRVQPEGKRPMSFEDFLRGNQQFTNNKKICSRIQI